MKRFIFKTLLLLLPIIVAAVSMEYLLRRIPNDYTYKKHYLDEHSRDIRLLILGSSETYFGIDPIYFSQNTFNASHVSQTLDLDYEIFDKYQNRFDNLKDIIISITYHTLWGRLKTGVEAWRMKNYALYYGIDTKSWSDNSEILNGKLAINIQRLFDHYFKKTNDITCSELGWATTFKSEIVNDLEETGRSAALRHTYKDINSQEKTLVFAENMKILNSLAEFCNQYNVRLTILTCPTYDSYRENLSEEQLRRMTDTLNEFAAEHANCQYINWLANPDFTAKDFFDGDHLNEKGAKKLSEKLACRIDSIQ